MFNLIQPNQNSNFNNLHPIQNTSPPQPNLRSKQISNPTKCKILKHIQPSQILYPTKSPSQPNIQLSPTKSKYKQPSPTKTPNKSTRIPTQPNLIKPHTQLNIKPNAKSNPAKSPCAQILTPTKQNLQSNQISNPIKSPAKSPHTNKPPPHHSSIPPSKILT